MHDLPPPKPFVFFAKAPKFSSILGGIIKIPPKPMEQSYKDLPCTDEDRGKIYELITALAENGKISLLFKQGKLKALGSEIEYIHPLKFLGVIFSNPQLKQFMREIFSDYFKRTGFLDGLGPSMMREYEKGKLFPYLAEFSRDVGVPEHELRPFIQALDWEGLVRYLIGPEEMQM
jgi:hypothetical protein